MKAIVLAAGQGTRLHPFTIDRPKCMVALRDRPLLEYQRQTFDRAGIRNVLVVTGHLADSVRAAGWKTVHNSEFASTNMVHSLFCAESEMDSDIVISYGDIIYEPRVLTALLESTAPISVVIDRGWQELWSARMENVLADAETLKLDNKGNIQEIGKKPQNLAEIEGQYIGLLRFSRSALTEIRKFYHALDRSALYDGKRFPQMYMTSFLQLLADQFVRPKAVLINHGWLEVDTVQDKTTYESLPARGPLFDFTQFR